MRRAILYEEWRKDVYALAFIIKIRQITVSFSRAAHNIKEEHYAHILCQTRLDTGKRIQSKRQAATCRFLCENESLSKKYFHLDDTTCNFIGNNVYYSLTNVLRGRYLTYSVCKRGCVKMSGITLKLDPERIREMPLVDLAFEVLKAANTPYYYRDLIMEVAKIRGVDADDLNQFIAQVYTEINIDGRFACVGNNVWGLKRWYPVERAEDPVGNTKRTRIINDDDDLDEDDEMYVDEEETYDGEDDGFDSYEDDEAFSDEEDAEVEDDVEIDEEEIDEEDLDEEDLSLEEVEEEEYDDFEEEEK